jgi:hypothetical protein
VPYRIWWCGTEYGIVTKCLFWSTFPFEACYSYARNRSDVMCIKG